MRHAIAIAAGLSMLATACHDRGDEAVLSQVDGAGGLVASADVAVKDGLAADGTEPGDAAEPNDAAEPDIGSGACDSPAACADDDPCTDDRCAPSGECVHTSKSCDDADPCTSDACQAGLGCVASPVACPASASVCAMSRCDRSEGCVLESVADGTPCDDGDPCTDEACKGGLCAAFPVACDDGNACTSDQCLPGVGCVGEPLPNCANDEACLGRLDGARCDDRDPSTSADMCLLGYCHGYSLTRLPGSTVEGQDELVLREIDHGAGGWTAVLWASDFFTQSYLLANVEDPERLAPHLETLQDLAFAGLHDGFVGDEDGRLWSFASGAWSPDNDWDLALGVSGRGLVTALFSARDIAAGGLPGPRHVWLAGDDHGAWLRWCHRDSQGVLCEAQSLGAHAAVPSAIGGVPRCDLNQTCTGAALALGADAGVGGGYNYTDTYENATGALATWTVGRLPESPANRATRALAAWGTGSAPSFLVVGDGGYLLHRSSDGTWYGPLGLFEGQSARDFSGTWVGAGVIIVSARRMASDGQTVFELWVARGQSDILDAASWVVHELGRYPSVTGDGLYDVHGRPAGEVRAVGAVGHAGGIFDGLDGAMWVRLP